MRTTAGVAAERERDYPACMTRAVVLGGGVVGSAMASDLAGDDDWQVTLVDRDEAKLQGLTSDANITGKAADCSDPATLQSVIADADVVLGALPSHMGLATLKQIIAAGKHYVDVSFMSEDALSLAAAAREAGSCVVVDCGVSPGISNIALGWAVRRMMVCERIEIYVGGLPVHRQWPYQYKAPFDPADVIEEYTRPARLVQGGKVVVREAMSDPELLDFPGVGTLQGFLTDGLRTLVKTLKVPFMVEKTLRYPGHIELMQVMRASGMFSQVPIEVRGQTVVPLDVTSALIFPMWKFDEGEEDLTVMRVTAQGVEKGQSVRYRWDLLDRYDRDSGLSSMARTTGFPAAIMARFIAQGRFDRPGVHPPETCGQQDGLLEAMLEALAQRGVDVRQDREEL